MKKAKKITETLSNGYSSESTQQELSNEYQHDRGVDAFQKSFRPRALDKSNLSIGRVKNIKAARQHFCCWTPSMTGLIACEKAWSRLILRSYCLEHYAEGHLLNSASFYQSRHQIPCHAISWYDYLGVFRYRNRINPAGSEFIVFFPSKSEHEQYAKWYERNKQDYCRSLLVYWAGRKSVHVCSDPP